MAKRIERAGSFRRKSGMRMSKGESALEHAMREMDVEKPADVATAELKRVPDLIRVEAGGLSQNLAIDIVADVDTVNKIVKVSNKDAENTVSVSVNGGTPVVVAADSSADLLVEDSTSTDSPLEL